MSKLVFLFVCVAWLQIAAALQCYNCIGSNCAKDSKNWEKTTCGINSVQPALNHEYACVKLTFKDRVSQQEMITRKCVIAEKKGDKLSFSCPQTAGDPISCPICTSDYCNSAQTAQFSLLALSCGVLAVFAPKFL